MELQPNKGSFQLLTVITTPKLADKTINMFKQAHMPLQYRLHAEGTAPSEIMDLLGLGSVDKCVLISMVAKPLSGIILKRLHTELQLDTVNSGIAFTLPLSGANSLIIRMLMQSMEANKVELNGKEANSMAEVKHALITAIVERGFSSDVMEAAKSAGARGGTVIHSHQIPTEEAGGFWGISAQEEKEIVLIIAEAEHRLPIMQSISAHCGMNSDAKGLVMSMPIDSVIGI